MSAETLARVGEPFFTTKDPGHGMGLGLFLVKALAAHLGGELAIDSSPGRGTTITLELPVSSEEAHVTEQAHA
jgi:two-component system sensor histidine kinase RegB